MHNYDSTDTVNKGSKRWASINRSTLYWCQRVNWFYIRKGLILPTWCWAWPGELQVKRPALQYNWLIWRSPTQVGRPVCLRDKKGPEVKHDTDPALTIVSEKRSTESAREFVIWSLVFTFFLMQPLLPMLFRRPFGISLHRNQEINQGNKLSFSVS